MINFKQREDVLPSTLILLAMLILLGGLIFLLVVPTPSVAGIATSRSAKKILLQKEAAQANIDAETAREDIIPRLWTGNPETISAGVLAQITNNAVKHGLAVGSFRPQRQIVLTGVTQLPYSIQLSGPYTGVAAVLATLDATGSKIVLTQIQMTSAQTSTQTAASAVTASIGISAYMPNDATLAPPAQIKTTGGKHG